MFPAFNGSLTFPLSIGNKVSRSSPHFILKLIWALTLRLFIQPQNMSQEWGEKKACSVNPPWQDCWDSSASTATLRELPASPSTRQQSSHSRPRPIRMLQRWQARARSSFALCRYGCCVFLFFWEKNLEIDGEGLSDIEENNSPTHTGVLWGKDAVYSNTHILSPE